LHTHLAPFYRLYCKIANLWDIDLKFSGLISDVNSDNSAKFCKDCSSCFSRKQATWAFLDFADPQLTDQTSSVKKIFLISASLRSLTSGGNFMVICPVVFEILGGGGLSPLSQMLVSCQKEQIALNVRITKLFELQPSFYFDCVICLWYVWKYVWIYF